MGICQGPMQDCINQVLIAGDSFMS